MSTHNALEYAECYQVFLMGSNEQDVNFNSYDVKEEFSLHLFLSITFHYLFVNLFIYLIQLFYLFTAFVDLKLKLIFDSFVAILLNTLLSQHYYFPKALVEDSHVFKGSFMVLKTDWQYFQFITRRNCLGNLGSPVCDLRKLQW